MEMERSMIRVVQMDDLRSLLGIRRVDKVPNARIKQFCVVMEGVDEKIDDVVLWWFSQVERMESDRAANRVYVRECAVSHLVGRLWKR